MRHYEGVYSIMNAVVYHSNTGESLKIADYMAKRLSWPLMDLLTLTEYSFDRLVLVFPVHCQNIPTAIRPILQRLSAGRVVVIATYGKMSHGNVLYECQRRYGWPVAAGAYVPTKHAYLPDDTSFDRLPELDVLIPPLLASHGEVWFPRCSKNPLADLAPGMRSRWGVRLKRGTGCHGCGTCRRCYASACVRCLRCVHTCPTGALTFEVRLFMKWYLRKKKQNELILYT